MARATVIRNSVGLVCMLTTTRVATIEATSSTTAETSTAMVTKTEQWNWQLKQHQQYVDQAFDLTHYLTQGRRWRQQQHQHRHQHQQQQYLRRPGLTSTSWVRQGTQNRISPELMKADEADTAYRMKNNTNNINDNKIKTSPVFPGRLHCTLQAVFFAGALGG